MKKQLIRQIKNTIKTPCRPKEKVNGYAHRVEGKYHEYQRGNTLYSVEYEGSICTLEKYDTADLFRNKPVTTKEFRQFIESV